MTSSSSHSGSSRSRTGKRASGIRQAAVARVFLAAALVVGAGAARDASGQTPTTPPAESGQAQPSQPAQPTTVEPQPIPLLQFPLQQPGRPPITPATPPSTTIPPWTPPTPPAPSQTNVPAPFPPGTPGGPGVAPGTFGRAPGLTIPSAFAPTVTTVRGALLEFHPTARASLEYSDNYFQSTSRSEENFRSILGPGFTMLLNGARTFGSLSTTIDLVHDTAPNSGDDIKVHPSLNGLIRYALTPRLSLSLSDTYVRDDSAQTADQSGIRRGRQTFSTNSATLTADWLLDQVATQAYYRNVLFFNEGGNQGQDSGSNRGDSITHILGINAATRVAIDYLVRAGYEFSRTDTSGGGTTGSDLTSHTVFASASRQFGLYASGGIQTSAQFQSEESTRIYNASLFGTYGLPTGLSVSARLGYSLLDSDNRSNEGGLAAELSASYRFARAVISAGVFQDFRQTAQQGQDFGTVESRSYFGSFLYQWTPFINTTLNATYTENEPTGTGNVNSGRTQTSLTYGASLNWQVLRWLTASLRYTYTKQTGNDAFNQSSFGSGDYAENRASITFFAVF